MNTIVVNGKKIEHSGSCVSINNGTIIVDGKVVAKESSQEINVVINGNISELECAGSVIVNGNVEGDVDCSGKCDIKGYVAGDVNASGSVLCGNVNGDVSATGSINITK